VNATGGAVLVLQCQKWEGENSEHNVKLVA
jgi:hypothetical protein